MEVDSTNSPPPNSPWPFNAAKWFSKSFAVTQTGDFDHSRQGFLAHSYLCVCAFVMVFPSPSVHKHTLHPIAVCVSLTHAAAFRNPHCRTRTSGAAYQSHRTLGHDWEALPTAVSCRPRPELRRSRCRDLPAPERWAFRDKPIWFDCTALMWITINTLSCPVIL